MRQNDIYEEGAALSIATGNSMAQEAMYDTSIMIALSIRQNTYIPAKRLFDVFAGIAGSMFLIPTAIILKILYLLSGDRAPVIYTQERIGKNGIPFKMYKFRSMVPNAEILLKEMLEDEKWRNQWKRKQKLDDDPRITKIGSIIRKTSIDELPQFINVLKGDMSVIGPRPLVEGELEEHGGLKIYQSVRPGISGWWACNGRSDTEYKERFELEYYYIKNCSIILDIRCLFRTVSAVLSKKGAK